MATPYVGLGTLVKVDHDADGSYTTVGLIKQTTPPGRERENVDATALADTLQTYKPGIETYSAFSFTQMWEPGDVDHEVIDTLFGNKTTVNWQLVYPMSKTDQFAGYVSGSLPQAVQIGEVLMREVTVQRTGAITRS